MEEHIENLRLAIRESYIYFSQEPELTIEQHVDLLRRTFKDFGSQACANGINNGMSGKYGYIQPKLNLHLMSIWIRCYINNCKPNDLKYSKDKL